MTDNALDTVLDALALPDAAHLGKRATKKLFYDHADLSAADRRAFGEDIDRIEHHATLTPHNTNVPAFEEDDQPYHSIAVFTIKLRQTKRVARLADCLQRAIPDPLLLVFQHKDDIAFNTASKRKSHADASATVVEDSLLTDWLKPDSVNAVDRAFWQSLALKQLPHSQLKMLYNGWQARLLALASARFSGQYHLPTQAEQIAARREQLTRCHQLEQDITRLRAAIKKETRFNEQVTLNTKIKALEAKKQTAIQALNTN